MCGIYGYLGIAEDFKFSEKELKIMASRLEHRGPDGIGYYCLEDEVGIGNVRLAIIDPEGGDQPFFSEDQNIVLVQNGEIFNFRDLKQELMDNGESFETHCDTEVLLKLYIKEGISFLSKLNGMFAIAIYHVAEKKLILARDRIGEKPLYFSNSENAFYFGSEIKAFLPYVSSDIDLTAIDAFLNLNYIPCPLTGFKSVRHVKPGHYIEVSKFGMKETEWWDLSYQKENKSWSESEWQEDFLKLMKDCVDKRLVSDVPFGAFLSGGVDSSTVVGFMSELLPKPVKTYTIGFPDKRFDESEYAEQASKRFNTEHKVEEVSYDIVDEWADFIYHCDKPHGDVSFLPMRKVAAIAAKDVKMVLTGDGADELFAGYDKYVSFEQERMHINKKSESFIEDLFSHISLFDSQSRRKLWKEEFLDEIDPQCSTKLFTEANQRVEHFDEINKMLYLEMRFLLSGNNLVKPDRMAMAESLETRAPFLDFRMMEFAFQTPGKFKLKNGDKKHLFKRAVIDLIGEDLSYRKKQMFTMPIGEWFKEALAGFCKEILLSESSKLNRYFKSNVIEKMLSDHISEVHNYTREIRALVSFELWLRRFH